MGEKRSNCLFVFILASSLLFPVLPAYSGQVAGSAHDFTTTGWSGGEICVACHTPHNADSAQAAQLWNHAVSTTNFSMYSSPSLDATGTGQPGGISRLCLSCHDGTVGVDSFGGTTGSTFMTGEKVVGSGGNLADDHPISIRYDTALSLSDGSLKDPAITTTTVGLAGSKSRTGTVDQLLLIDGTVQCTSCHDVHNNFTAGEPLLRISTAGSQLCLTCHDK